MANSSKDMRNLIDKLDQLPPEQVAEVEDFINFLREKEQDRRLAQAGVKAAEPSFRKVWDNSDDSVYDPF